MTELWYEWNKDDYPICPKCQRSRPTFKAYKKDVLRIYKLKPPKDKIPVLGKCLWGCEFNALIPKEWIE